MKNLSSRGLVGTGTVCPKLFCHILRYSCESQDSYGGCLKFLRLSRSVVQDHFFDHLTSCLTGDSIPINGANQSNPICNSIPICNSTPLSLLPGLSATRPCLQQYTNPPSLSPCIHVTMVMRRKVHSSSDPLIH